MSKTSTLREGVGNVPMWLLRFLHDFALFYKISGYVFLARTLTLNIKDAGAAPASFEPLYRSV